VRMLRRMAERFHWSIRAREFDALVKRLERRGFQLVGGSEPVPVQIWGMLPDQRAFSFRARHTSAWLEVGPAVGSSDFLDVLDGPIRQVEVDRWPWPQAGWLSADETEAELFELLDRIRLAQAGGAR
jgi:hypothetical protein